jgi:uncharacterized protein YggE
MTDRTITVEATGRETTEADAVRVRIDATGRGETQTAARRSAADCVAAIRDALGPFDLPSDGLERREATVEHRSSLFDADDDDPAYRATVECTLTCRPTQTEDVFVAVGDAGGAVTAMDRIVDPDRWTRLHERALASAAERARRKAAAIAEATGVTVGSVRTIESGDDEGMARIVEDALADEPTEHVDLDGIEATASVEAVFEIEGSER